MPIASEVIARQFLNISAGVDVPVNFPLHTASEVQVLYGKSVLVAVLDTDYTITLNPPSYATFVLTPLQSFIDKINALIAADATETNSITVRSALPYTTDASASLVRDPGYVANELDRILLRLLDLQDGINRSLSLSATFVGDAPLLQLTEIEANKTIKVNEAGDALVPGPDAADVAAAQGHAQTASTAATTATTKAGEAATSAQQAVDAAASVDGAALQAGIDANAAAITNITAGVSAAFDTFAEVETKFGQIDAELDVILPQGSTGLFRLPQLTTTEINALTGMVNGDEVWNTTTGELWRFDTSVDPDAWGPVSSGLYASGDMLAWFDTDAPDGHTRVNDIGTVFGSSTIYQAVNSGGSNGRRLGTDHFAIMPTQPSSDGGSQGLLIRKNGSEDPANWTDVLMGNAPSDWRMDGYERCGTNKLLIFGGTNWYGSTVVNRTALYDPTTNTVTEGDADNMPSARRAPEYCALWDGRVAVLGGYTTWNNSNGTSQRQLWIFDPSQPSGSQWSTLVSSMPNYHRQGTGWISQLDSNTLIVHGGHVNTSGSQDYRIFTVNLTTGAVTTYTGPYYTPNVTSTSFTDGRMNLGDGDYGWVGRSSTLYRFDPATSTFLTRQAPMSLSDRNFSDDNGKTFYSISTTLQRARFAILIQKD